MNRDADTVDLCAEGEAGVAAPSASLSGFDAPPPHYAGVFEGLEAIDVIWQQFRELVSSDADADRLMIAFCIGSEMKYALRQGRKTDGDADKARWHSLFASYVNGEGPDPRTSRPGWTPHPNAPRPSGGRS